MSDSIRADFEANLARVRAIVSLYDSITGSARGRARIEESDILRVGVVLLHASLEDLLRNLALVRLPEASAEILRGIPFAGGDGRSIKLTLADLAGFRSNTVDEFIRASIALYLDSRSYNDTNDLSWALAEMQLDGKAVLPPFASSLQSMILRRHHIVHRLDRNNAPGSGQHRARSISKSVLNGWIQVVESFGGAVLDAHRGPIAASTGGEST